MIINSKVNIVLSLSLVLIAMCGVAVAEVPGNPTSLTNTTGDCWINHTWSAGANTDSYNVSVNDVWHNTTTNTFYKDVYSHLLGTWQNITVWGYNSSYEGNLSSTSISQNTEVTGCTVVGLTLTAVISILNQIPDILRPIPDILAALAKVAIFGAVITLVVAIVFSLRTYIEKLLKI